MKYAKRNKMQMKSQEENMINMGLREANRKGGVEIWQISALARENAKTPERSWGSRKGNCSRKRRQFRDRNDETRKPRRGSSKVIEPPTTNAPKLSSTLKDLMPRVQDKTIEVTKQKWIEDQQKKASSKEDRPPRTNCKSIEVSSIRSRWSYLSP